VLAELDHRFATSPLRHDSPVPFFHLYVVRRQNAQGCFGRGLSADHPLPSIRDAPKAQAGMTVVLGTRRKTQ